MNINKMIRNTQMLSTYQQQPNTNYLIVKHFSSSIVIQNKNRPRKQTNCYSKIVNLIDITHVSNNIRISYWIYLYLFLIVYR